MWRVPSFAAIPLQQVCNIEVVCANLVRFVNFRVSEEDVMGVIAHLKFGSRINFSVAYYVGFAGSLLGCSYCRARCSVVIPRLTRMTWRSNFLGFLESIAEGSRLQHVAFGAVFHLRSPGRRCCSVCPFMKSLCKTRTLLANRVFRRKRTKMA